MKEYNRLSGQLLDFIENSPSSFHVVENIARRLEEEGFCALKEQEDWILEEGKAYYVERNASSIIAFRLPRREEEDAGEWKGFHIIASHSDSPTFKIKEHPEINQENAYIKLNTEKYGGMIMSGWLDRPLSVAGRIVVQKDGELMPCLVNVDRDLLVIPGLAIHMNREANKSEYNPQVDMLPLFAGNEGKGLKSSLMDKVAKAAGVKAKDILGHDLFLYVREKGRIFGANREFILSPKLDDLQCVYASLEAMCRAVPEQFVTVMAVFDNEEVGSGTRQGADSSFLQDVLWRICECTGIKEAEYRRRLAESFVLSADNAHAVHPNHPEKADPTNRPYLNGGPVIKFHGGQKYTTDAVSGAFVKNLCQKAQIPYQTYANRSDVAGGSTLGNISTAHVSVASADMGFPQLAMHSAVETGGVRDLEYGVSLFEYFYRL